MDSTSIDALLEFIWGGEEDSNLAPDKFSPDELAALISHSNGKIFGCDFIKRSDGSLRRFNGRIGVKKNLKGIGPAYDFAEKGLIPAYDLVKKKPISIPIEGIREVRIYGETYKVKQIL